MFFDENGQTVTTTKNYCQQILSPTFVNNIDIAIFCRRKAEKVPEESQNFIESEIPHYLVVYYHHHQVRRQKSYTEVIHELEPDFQTRIEVNPQMNFGYDSRRLFV